MPQIFRHPLKEKMNLKHHPHKTTYYKAAKQDPKLLSSVTQVNDIKSFQKIKQENLQITFTKGLRLDKRR